MTLLTTNFDDSEFDVNEAVPSQYYGNRDQLAQVLQQFRDMWGVPIIITSCYRDPARNAATPGAVDNSQHLTASASDNDFGGGMDPQTAATQLLSNVAAGTAPQGWSQAIFYEADHHVHIGISQAGLPNGQMLIKYSDGSYDTLSSANVGDLPSDTINP